MARPPILGAAPPAVFGRGRAVELRLESRIERDWTVLEVGGEVDLSTAASLRARIDQIVQDGSRRLVVDLDGVGFMDSSGLGVLVAGMKGMRQAGGDLALVCKNASILKVFTVTGLDRVFAIGGSVAEATGG